MAKGFIPRSSSILVTVISFLMASTLVRGVEGTIGVNYGTVANNLPPPPQVAHFLLESTFINRVKLYDANPDILKAFAHTGVAVTVTVPNDQIPRLTKLNFAQQWVEDNIQPYTPATNIVRILVGNEVISTANKFLIGSLVPAMQTLHTALVAASLDRRIQVSTPHSLGVLSNSSPPSTGKFRLGYESHVLRPLLSFLRATNSPFMVNPYPFFGCSSDSLDYALFRPNAGVFDENTELLYTNMLDAQLDAVFSAMKSLGFDDLEIVIAETGWPSMGDSTQVGVDANFAAEYNGNLMRHVTSGTGTPLMPNRTFETYIFALFNEDLKPGPTSERNFGLFRPDMTPVYDIGILRPTARSSREIERSRRSRSRSEREREKTRDGEFREREKEREPRERDRESRRYKDKKEDGAEPEVDPERDQRTVFAYQISLKANERDVYEFFSRAGKVRDVRLIMDRNSRRSKGVGYVEFYDVMSVPMAIALSGQPLLGQPVMVKPSEAEKNLVQSTTSVAAGQTGPYAGGARRLYVGNLHFNITEDQLRQVFEAFGTVELVQLPLDETGHSKGFGFVQFARLEDAKNALNLNGQLEIGGRVIKVSTVTDQNALQDLGTNTADLDDDEGGGLSLNSSSRALLMAKLDRSGTASSITSSVGMPINSTGLTASTAPILGAATVVQSVVPTISGLAGGVQIPTNGLPTIDMIGIPSECLLLKNMFDPNLETESDFDLDIKEDVQEECSKFGKLKHIYVDRDTAGFVYLRFEDTQGAINAQRNLHGRWFAGKMITATFMVPQTYEAKFPDSNR